MTVPDTSLASPSVDTPDPTKEHIASYDVTIILVFLLHPSASATSGRIVPAHSPVLITGGSFDSEMPNSLNNSVG